MPSMVGEWASFCFNDPAFADIRVSGSDGQEFMCLSFVMCSASDVFKCMLSSDLIEGSTRAITIKEVSSENLEGFLKFIHGGEFDLGASNLVQMWELANRFQVAGLEILCQDYAKNKLKISTENWTDLLNSSIVIGFEEVTRLCEDFVVDTYHEGLDLHNFEDLEAVGMKGIIGAVTANFAGMENEYYYFVVRVTEWVELRKDLLMGEDGEDVMEILQGLDLSVLGPYYLCCLCSKGLAIISPQFAVCITRALGHHARSYKGLNTGDCDSPLRMVAQAGCWEEWAVPRSDWYYISGCGAQGRNGFGTEGGSGAVISGAFYLSKGDQLRMLVGHTCDGGGSTCVVRVRQEEARCMLLIVAGGGGGGSEKPGKDAVVQSKICWREELTKNNKNKNNGKSCWGFLIEDFLGDGGELMGPCDMCDGGIFTNLQAGGGAGVLGGKASRRGGEGGSSYLNPMAEHGLRGTYGVFAHITIWGGMFP